MLNKILRTVLYYGATTLLFSVNTNVLAEKTIPLGVTAGSSLGLFFLESTNSISADGRYVVFLSTNPKLIPNDTNNLDDIFVYDTLNKNTTRISVSSDGKQANNWSYEYSISADGRYIAFSSGASNLISGDKNDGEDVFVHDRLTKKIERVSLYSNGTEIGRASLEPRISANGRYVTFWSIVQRKDGHGDETNYFIHDRMTKKTASLKKINQYDWSSNGNSTALISDANSNNIVFSAFDNTLIKTDKNNHFDVISYNRITDKLELISVASKGTIGNGDSYSPSISPDGRYIAFMSSASNLVPHDTNKTSDIFVRDLLLKKTSRISVSSNGIQSNASSDVPRISADGRYIAYKSSASNLVAGDTNNTDDIFVYDRIKKTTTRVSVDAKGQQINQDHLLLGINADGRHVAFISLNENLTHPSADVFVHDRLLDTAHHADLNITSTTKPATLKLNTQGTYLYTVTNNGVDVVNDVSFLHLVSGGSAVNFKPSQGQCTPSSTESVCHLGKLAAGKKLTVQVVVKAQSKTLNQQMTVSGAPVDSVPGNSQISVSTPVK